jgi:hypothetical protein
MGIRHLAAALHHCDDDNPLTPTEKLLLVVLADRMNDDHGGWCWPSYNTVARLVGINRRNTILGIQRLEESGLLLVARDTGTRRPNRYRLADCLVSPATPASVAGDTSTSVASDTLNRSKQKETRGGPASIHPSSRSVAEVIDIQNGYR